MRNYNGEVSYDLSEISAELDITKASMYLLGLGFYVFYLFHMSNKTTF